MSARLIAEGERLRGKDAMTEAERQIVERYREIHGTIYAPKTKKYANRKDVK